MFNLAHGSISDAMLSLMKWKIKLNVHNTSMEFLLQIILAVI